MGCNWSLASLLGSLGLSALIRRMGITCLPYSPCGDGREGQRRTNNLSEGRGAREPSDSHSGITKGTELCVGIRALALGKLRIHSELHVCWCKVGEVSSLPP